MLVHLRGTRTENAERTKGNSTEYPAERRREERRACVAVRETKSVIEEREKGGERERERSEKGLDNKS